MFKQELIKNVDDVLQFEKVFLSNVNPVNVKQNIVDLSGIMMANVRFNNYTEMVEYLKARLNPNTILYELLFIEKEKITIKHLEYFNKFRKLKDIPKADNWQSFYYFLNMVLAPRFYNILASMNTIVKNAVDEKKSEFDDILKIFEKINCFGNSYITLHKNIKDSMEKKINEMLMDIQVEMDKYKDERDMCLKNLSDYQDKFEAILDKGQEAQERLIVELEKNGKLEERVMLFEKMLIAKNTENRNLKKKNDDYLKEISIFEDKVDFYVKENDRMRSETGFNKNKENVEIKHLKLQLANLKLNFNKMKNFESDIKEKEMIIVELSNVLEKYKENEKNLTIEVSNYRKKYEIMYREFLGNKHLFDRLKTQIKDLFTCMYNYQKSDFFNNEDYEKIIVLSSDMGYIDMGNLKMCLKEMISDKERIFELEEKVRNGNELLSTKNVEFLSHIKEEIDVIGVDFLEKNVERHMIFENIKSILKKVTKKRKMLDKFLEKMNDIEKEINNCDPLIDNFKREFNHDPSENFKIMGYPDNKIMRMNISNIFNIELSSHDMINLISKLKMLKMEEWCINKYDFVIKKFMFFFLKEMNKFTSDKKCVWFRNCLSRDKLSRIANETRSIQKMDKIFYYTYINPFDSPEKINFEDFIKENNKRVVFLKKYQTFDKETDNMISIYNNTIKLNEIKNKRNNNFSKNNQKYKNKYQKKEQRM